MNLEQKWARPRWNATRRMLAPIGLVALVIAGCGGNAGDTGSASPGAADTSATGDEAATDGTAPTAEELLTYTGDDRQEILERGAAEEGGLFLYTATVDEPRLAMIEAFQAKYPDLDVEVSCCPGSPDDVAIRAAAELEAGRSGIDVVESFGPAIVALKNAGLLAEFHSVNWQDYDEGPRDPEGQYLPSRTGARGIAVNTDAVPADEAPQTWEDLLDPAWHGLIAITGGASAPRLAGLLNDAFGEEYVKALGEQDLTTIEASPRAVADMVVSGEMPISVSVALAHVDGAIREGAPVAWFPTDPLEISTTLIGIVQDPPNPHAALLWVDFVLSPEGQQIWVDNGYESLHPDFAVEDYEGLEILDPNLRADYLDREREWTDLVNTYWR